VTGDITSISIGGDLIESAIRSDSSIGSIKVGGDFAGTAQEHATISALGGLAPHSDAKAMAIGSIAIGGSADHAQILAGYDRAGVGVNANVRVGKVSVAGNWSASSLVAGVDPGEDTFFGTADDKMFPGGNSVIASIASIVIKGAATGSDDSSEHFAFVSEEIGKVRVGETQYPLQDGASNDLSAAAIGSSNNFVLQEIG